jgi:hypothetical protein
MKISHLSFLVVSLIDLSFGSATVDKIDVNILEPSAGKCAIKINEGKSKSVDVDIELHIEAKDITVRLFS